jgi:repressor LexA
MKELHISQRELVSLLKSNIEDPLTIRELQERLNLSSTSLVHHHISQLEKKGYLRRNPNNPKDYQILSDSPEKSITYLNMYGCAQCGPRGSIFDGSPIDRVPLSTRMLGFPSEEAFMVKAKGESMMPKIKEKDVVIARKVDYAQNGSIVVCVNSGEVLIKQIQKENDNVILVSLNPEFRPFIANRDDFKVEGIVKGVYSYELDTKNF